MSTAQSLPGVGPTPNEILADKISNLAAHIHAATYRFLVMVREFDEREAWAEMGARSCAHWLNWRCGISLRTAREKIRVAHSLAVLENTSAAFSRGELSYSKVRAITRVSNPDNEDTLLNIAVHGTAAQLEYLVRCEMRTEREADIQSRTDAAYAAREFGWRTDSDGSVVFFGRLPAELAEHVIKAIEANLQNGSAEPSGKAETAAAGNSPVKSRASASNDAVANDVAKTRTVVSAEGDIDDSVKICDCIDTHSIGSGSAEPQTAASANGDTNDRVKMSDCAVMNYIDSGSAGTCVGAQTNHDGNGSAKPPVDHNINVDSVADAPAASLATRRADALVALCQSQCNGYEVTLHVAAGAALHANATEKTGTLPLQAAERLCCDAAIVPVTEDEQGNVLDIGRKTRQIPPAIRRALEIRDKRCCRFPGCTHSRHLHGHHIKHWAYGGKTCLDNLVLLCWHHHHLVHEGGFSCLAVKRPQRKEVSLIFQRPDGVMIPEAFKVTPVEGAIEDHHPKLDITASTCMARDGHSSLDVDVVIDALAFIRARRDKHEL